MPPMRTSCGASSGAWVSSSLNETNVTTFCGRSFTSIGESCMT